MTKAAQSVNIQKRKQKQKRILLINDFKKAGGAEVVFSDHINILNKTGRYKVFTLYGAQSIQKYYNKLWAVLVFFYNLLFGWLVNLFRFLMLQPVIIHVYNWYHVFTPSLLVSLWVFKKVNQFKKPIKIIYSAHDFHLIQSASAHGQGVSYFLFRRLPGLFFYKLLKLPCVFDVVYAPSKTVAKALEAFFEDLRCPKKVKTLYNPLPQEFRDLLVANTLDAKAWAKRKNKNTLKIIFVGRVDAEKQVVKTAKYIDKAAKKLNIDVEFTVVGSGAQLSVVKELAPTLSIKMNVLGRKPLHELPGILKEHDVLVLNSKAENAPLVMREAAIVNLYLLVTDADGRREFAKVLGGAFTFEPDNLLDFTDKLQKVFKKVKRGDAPRATPQIQKILDLFSQERFLAKLEKEYQ